MNAVSQIVRPSLVVLPRATWTRDRQGAWNVQAATWNAVRGQGLNPPIAAVVGCPACSHAIVIATADAVKMGGGRIAHEIMQDGLVRPEVRCTTVLANGRACGFARPIMLERWQDERPIWCCIYTDGADPEPKSVYCHATSRTEALRVTKRVGRVLIDVAPAVGWKS